MVLSSRKLLPLQLLIFNSWNNLKKSKVRTIELKRNNFGTIELGVNGTISGLIK